MMRRVLPLIQTFSWSLSLLAAAGVAMSGCGTKSIDGAGPTGIPGGGVGGTTGGLCVDNSGVPGLDPKVGGGIGIMTPSSLSLDGLTTASDPPPAISGGTMIVLRDGTTVVAADADRDRIFVVDLGTRTVQWSIGLTRHEQPGRLVQDGAGMVHVVLRGSGTLATLDPAAGKVTQRRGVCAAPRGLAYDKATDRLHVACAGGELVTFTPTGAAPERTLKLQQDLRDVVVDGPRLMVTRFRSAEVMVLDSQGAMMEWTQPASFTNLRVQSGTTFSPAVAWRATAMPDGGMVMSHQRGMDGEVGRRPGGYGGFNPCDSIVHTSVTRVKAGERPVAGPALPGFVLPVDLAVSPDGQRVAIVAAGNGHSVDAQNTPKLFVTDMDDVTSEWAGGCEADGKHGPGACNGGVGGSPGGIAAPLNPDGSCPIGLRQCLDFCLDSTIACDDGMSSGSGGIGGSTGAGAASGTGGSGGSAAEATSSDVAPGPSMGATSGGAGGSPGSGGQGAGPGTGTGTKGGSGGQPGSGCGMTIPGTVEPVSVAFAGDARVVVQTREPAALFIVTDAGAERISLSQESRADTGHIVFHSNSGGGLACASCHPEGHEDGRLWTFECEGTRRTQDLSGGLSGTEPFHWNGDLGTFPKLVDTVFVGRMSGPVLTRDQTAAALSWINTVPARTPLRPKTDPAVARGQALFESQAVGCASCHTGASLTNNTTVDVHTEGLFQVPSLRGIGARAPFMHDGCARTLDERFTNTICGGGDAHGKTSQLNPAQLLDLVGYLESL